MSNAQVNSTTLEVKLEHRVSVGEPKFFLPVLSSEGLELP